MQGDEGGYRLGINAWLPNCLADHFGFFLFPFLLLSPAGKAYAPEFYYDTYNPLWQNRPRVYSYSLQWTQMNPDAVDRILAYRLGIRQVRREIGSCGRCLLMCWPLWELPGLILFYSFFFLFCFTLHYLLIFLPPFTFCESESSLLLLEDLLPSCRSSPLPCAHPGN